MYTTTGFMTERLRKTKEKSETEKKVFLQKRAAVLTFPGMIVMYSSDWSRDFRA